MDKTSELWDFSEAQCGCFVRTHQEERKQSVICNIEKQKVRIVCQPVCIDKLQCEFVLVLTFLRLPKERKAMKKEKENKREREREREKADFLPSGSLPGPLLVLIRFSHNRCPGTKFVLFPIGVSSVLLLLSSASFYFSIQRHKSMLVIPSPPSFPYA